ncbi:hypothetical protein D3C80_1198310 [compost metagenome]
MTAEHLNQADDLRHMKGHCNRNSQQIGRLLLQITYQAFNRHVGAQVEGIPALHFKKVRQHPQADFMQFFTYTDCNQPLAAALCPDPAGVQLGDDALGAGCAVVLLSDRDLSQLPQPPDFVLALLEDMKVNILNRYVVIIQLHYKFRSLAPFSVQQKPEVLLCLPEIGLIRLQKRRHTLFPAHMIHTHIQVAQDQLSVPRLYLDADCILHQFQIDPQILSRNLILHEQYFKPNNIVNEQKRAFQRHALCKITKMI